MIRKIVPAYNEFSGKAAALVEEIAFFEAYNLSYEIIVSADEKMVPVKL
jgi:hypothetical protein